MTYFIPGYIDSDNSLEIHSMARNNHTLLSSVTNLIWACLPESGTHFTCCQPSHDLALVRPGPFSVGTGQSKTKIQAMSRESARLADCCSALMAQESHLLEFFLQIYTIPMPIVQEVLAFLSYIYLTEHISFTTVLSFTNPSHCEF